MLQPNRQHFYTRRNLSETSRQIHLPRKQRLINWKRHRHVTNESYGQLSIGSQSYGNHTWPIKWNGSFFQAAVVLILLYGCTTWTLTKQLKKKLDGNYTRILKAILNKSWWQHSTKHQLYGHLPPIMKTVQVRRTRHTGHCWRSKDKHISDVLLWTPAYGQAKAGWPAQTYIQQLCRIRDVALKTCQKRWMIGRSGERGSGISVLVARHDDDDFQQDTLPVFATLFYNLFSIIQPVCNVQDETQGQFLRTVKLVWKQSFSIL